VNGTSGASKWNLISLHLVLHSLHFQQTSFLSTFVPSSSLRSILGPGVRLKAKEQMALKTCDQICFVPPGNGVEQLVYEARSITIVPGHATWVLWNLWIGVPAAVLFCVEKSPGSAGQHAAKNSLSPNRSPGPWASSWLVPWFMVETVLQKRSFHEFSSPKISVTRCEKLETDSEHRFQSRRRSFPFSILTTEKLLRYARSRSRGQVWTLEGLYWNLLNLPEIYRNLETHAVSLQKGASFASFFLCESEVVVVPLLWSHSPGREYLDLAAATRPCWFEPGDSCLMRR
jgi:hypothetical protein